jgi:hypothetical protein
MNLRTFTLTAALLFAALIAGARWTPASAVTFNPFVFKGSQCVNTKTGKVVAASNCKTAHAKPTTPSGQN